MSFENGDRIYETSTTTGTGTYTLEGAATGFQAFSTLGNGNVCTYFATDDTNWEVGLGTVATGPSTLARTAIFASSNAGSAVNWAAGTRKIRCGLPAANSPRNAVVARSSNTILAQADFGTAVIATSTFTQTLTAAATLGDGWHCAIKNDGVGVITIDPNGAETIDGAATIALAPGEGCFIFCNGTAFYTVGRRVANAGRVQRTAGSITTTSTSLVDLTGATVTLTTGANPVFFGQDASASNSGVAGRETYFALLNDATNESGTVGRSVYNVAADSIQNACTSTQTAALTAAAHTFKVQWAVSADTGTLYATTNRIHTTFAKEVR